MSAFSLIYYIFVKIGGEEYNVSLPAEAQERDSDGCMLHVLTTFPLLLAFLYSIRSCAR